MKVDGKSAAWITKGGGFTIRRAYRAALGDKEVPEKVREAIDRARKRVGRKEAH